MDFARVLQVIRDFFRDREDRFALVGAFGLSCYGQSRATQDIDLVVEQSARNDLVKFLESIGYETIHASPGFSHHLHAIELMGRVDLIYLDARTAALIFDQAKTVEYADGLWRVPRPEHLAAMKVFAMKSDPERTFKEMADIQFLMGLPGVDLDEIRASFERFDLLHRYDEIRRILDQR